MKAGVVGVGSMGQNHARVYRELPEAELVGVADAEPARAATVANEFDTEVFELGEMLDVADVVSIAVPTQYHYTIARQCIEAGVDVLVEKPFVDELDHGRELIEMAGERDVTLQVGHIERFNPAVLTLMDLVSELDIIAVQADRLGPPADREIEDTAVMDLMIHDIDILLALLDEEIETVEAVGTAETNYAEAILQTGSGTIGQLTASRVTQEKVRKLTISATNCRVKVDYMQQSIEICRQSLPEPNHRESSVRYRHENVVEEVLVENREPLKNELSSFIEAARAGEEPLVTGEDGLRAISIARRIDDLARERTARPPGLIGD